MMTISEAKELLDVIRGRSQIMSRKKMTFSTPPHPLVTNFPKKEKFCLWTVTNSSTPLLPKA